MMDETTDHLQPLCLPRHSSPSWYTKFDHPNLMFLRIIKRICAKRTPVLRVLVLTRQHIYLCGIDDGDLKRAVPIALVSHITITCVDQQQHQQQVLLKFKGKEEEEIVDGEEDLLMTFISDKRNLDSQSLDRFVSLLQLDHPTPVVRASSAITTKTDNNNNNSNNKLTNRAQLMKSRRLTSDTPQARLEAMLEKCASHQKSIAQQMKQQQQEEEGGDDDIEEETNYNNNNNDRLFFLQVRNHRKVLLDRVNEQRRVRDSLTLTQSLVSSQKLQLDSLYRSYAHAQSLIESGQALESENNNLREELQRLRVVLSTSSTSSSSSRSVDHQILKSEFVVRQLKVKLVERIRPRTEAIRRQQRAEAALAEMVFEICSMQIQKQRSVKEQRWKDAVRTIEAEMALLEREADEFFCLL
eukprot:PhM_4_TR15219/c0_g2_i1/m.1784